jgi:hypothetical protein
LQMFVGHGIVVKSGEVGKILVSIIYNGSFALHQLISSLPGA